MRPEQVRASPWAGVLVAFFEPEMRAWYGTESLRKVFWGYGVGVSTLLALLYASAFYEDRPLSQQFMLLCFAAYTVWILVSVWRCATNSSPFWGLLARWLTVAWAANTALVLVALQADLVVRYLGR
ncbi:MAG: hypothetical protein AB7F22_19050 [Reyranella sp.]|uniref:hypothetical protein n=1 Tax=Reyranella sp. TaxID=1929291 RepID=UPI003D103C4E